MDQFQIPELSFEFDFQHDFTLGENCVINEILANPIESSDIFATENALTLDQSTSSSFFNYLCNDFITTTAGNSSGDLSNNQLVPYDDGFSQVSYDVDSYARESNGIDCNAANQNVNFDWTKFLDESSADGSVIESVPESQVEQVQYNHTGGSGMICENGYVYQELKTLDIPQMYSDLNQTFDLMRLKEHDKAIDYSAFDNETEFSHKQPNNNPNSASIDSKVFLLPFQLNESGAQSLLQIAEKLKDDPTAIHSMVSEQNSKLLIPSRPKQIKEKSMRYLTVNEQLHQIRTKEIILPSIERKPQQRKRKQKPKIDKEKAPVQYTLKIILEDIMENGNFSMVNNNTTISNNNNFQSVSEISPKSRKSSPKARSTKQTRSASKTNRRSNKKSKSI